MMIRQATIDDLDQMIALIHSTSKKMVDKNIYQWSHCCDPSELKKEIEAGEVFLLVDNKRLIGSYSIRPLDKEYPVQIEKSHYLFRLLIHPFYQDKNMEEHIFKYVKHQYKKKDHVLLDCWAGNEKLCQFYREHDCQFIGDFPTLDYKISVFQVGKK